MNKGITQCSMSSVPFMAMMLLLSVTGAPAQTPSPPVSATQKIPFNRTVLTPCKEKRIRFNGAFQAQYQISREASGQTLIEGDFQAAGLTGSGLTSRGEYKAVGTGRLESRGPAHTSFTYVLNFSLNKSGTDESLMGHVKVRINVDANGGVTTKVVAANIDCTN